MKDRVFSGPDVEEALASAAASLGLPKAQLRYVVLEPGTAGGRGLKPTPARIAVLIQDTAGRGAPRPAKASDDPLDLRSGLRSAVRAVAEAGGLEIEVEFEETDEALLVQLRGRDSAFFHGEDGRGAPLFALEHLLQRMYATALHPLALRVRCEGFRERRDQALVEEARKLAEAVLEDGQPRSMEPLNSYERRIVHLALHDDARVTTFSVGEGRDRHVTVALRGARPEGESEPPAVGGGGGGRDDG